MAYVQPAHKDVGHTCYLRGRRTLGARFGEEERVQLKGQPGGGWQACGLQAEKKWQTEQERVGENVPKNARHVNAHANYFG